MDLQVLKLVAIAQGAFVIGICGMIVYFYLRYSPKNTVSRNDIVLMTISYMGLLSATIISVDRAIYEWGDVWFWITGTAYLIGDVTLFRMYRRQVRKHFGTSKKIKL